MRNTPIRRSTKRIRRESEKHRLKRLAEQSKPVSRPAITRKSRPKPRNAKRKASEFARAYGSEERIAFVRSLPCVVCGNASTRPCENAHVKTGGMGRKADAALIVPLCSPHHQSLHHRGIDTFEARYGVDLAALASQVESRWRAHAGESA